jgi:hypothetical protein
MWAPPYISNETLADYLRDTVLVDEDLTVYVEAASRAIDDHTNRQFGQVDAPEERRYTAWWDYGRGRWVVDIDDLTDSTGLTVAVPGGAIDLYTLEPANAVVKGLAYTRLVVDPGAAHLPCGEAGEVAATGLWGWFTVPPAVKLATKLQGSRFAHRQDSPHGVAGSPEFGTELRLLSKVDPDVGVSLRRYRRPRKVGG